MTVAASEADVAVDSSKHAPGRPRQLAFPPAGHSHSAPIRAHLAELATFGMSPGDVAELAGLPRGLGTDIAGGRMRYVERGTALAIMRIHAHPEEVDARHRVSAHGAKRRVQALVAMGWSLGQVAQWLDMHQSVLSVILHDATLTVTGRQHRQIADMYEQWHMRIPAVRAVKSIQRAAREGWRTPLAWDDIDRDAKPPTHAGTAPPRTVDEIAVELALAGERVRLSRADRVEIVARAHARRWSDLKIARITGIVDKTVIRIREDLGLPGLEMHEML